MEGKYDFIEVDKFTVMAKNKKGKMVKSLLDIVDIYDSRTMNDIDEKDDLRDNNKKYEKKKIVLFKGQNLKFYKGMIRKVIDQHNLFGNGNKLCIEYLTPEGFKSIGTAYGKEDYNMVMATPTIDKGIPSGNYNNAIEKDEPIVFVRINIFREE